MTLDYIAIGIIVVSIGVIVFFVAKKFPIIASINTKVLQKNKQEKVKKGLIEVRLLRKLGIRDRKGAKQANGQQKINKSVFTEVHEFLKKVEKKYREKITEMEPLTEEGTEKKINIIVEEAETLAEQDKLKEAEGKYIEAISLDNKSIEAYKGLAEVYTERKDFDHAKEIYKYLLKIYDTGEQQTGGGQSSQPPNGNNGQNGLVKSVSFNSEVAGYHTDLGEVYLLAGGHNKAMACFLEAIKLEPNNPRIIDLAIKTAVILKDKDMAINYYKKLKEVNSENEKLVEFKKEISKL